MFPRVTAILVVQHGGDRLRETLDALAAQRRTPDALAVVLMRPDQATRDAVASAHPSHVVQVEEPLPFGEAVRAVERLLDPPASDADSLWLLAEDTAPEPGALAALVGTLETAKSVAVAGPKLAGWDAPERIVAFGRTLTRFGRSVPLVDGELDQGQHDGLSDVLGVDPAAMLVRHAVFRSLEGFDPALPAADDALDFCVRARLAGHRVEAVPAARVRFAGAGVAGQAMASGGRAARRRAREARAEELHRRLAYAPAAIVPLHWLSLLPLALLRSVRLLLTKAPGAIGGEFRAALRAMATPGRVARSRRVLRRERTAPWSSIAPLRMQSDELRHRRQHAAEERRERARGRVEELQFLGTGGGWLLLGAVAASVVLFLWLVGAGGVGGGALLPLSSDLGELWRNAAYGWRDVGPGFVGAADPFSGVLAVLGSAAFWAPSAAVTAVWLAAIPAAALGAWFAASRLSERGSLRVAAGIVWGLAPTFLTALADGRPGPVLAHVLLPWLAFAVFGAATSWAAAATASLLFAAVVACAPSLAPALLLGWILALAVSGRASVRLIGIPLPALALALPLIVEQVGRGTPLSLLADPGLPVGSATPTTWQLALGQPVAGWGGWETAFGGAASALVPAPVILAVLLAPLAIAAVAAVAAPRLRPALLALAVAAVGFATAVGATAVAVAAAGDAAVPLWTGAGLSLAWLGLVLAAVLAIDALPRGTAIGATVVSLGAVAAVLPLLVAIATAAVAVHPAGERTVPAFVAAEAETDPRVTTLEIQPLDDGGIRATLERGTGATLDAQSTLAQTDEELTQAEEELATLAGNLASRSGFDADAAISEFGVSFVLLQPPGSALVDDREALAAGERARVALDENPALVAVGETDFGTLWRFVAAEADAPAAAIPEDAGAPWALWITIGQLLVVGSALLLSIPTGAGREPDRTPRPTRGARGRGRPRPPVAEAAEDTPPEGSSPGESPPEHSATATGTEPEPSPEPEPEPSSEPESDTEPAPTATRGGDDARES
jgi:GT2 family glycosyltransferase